MKRRGFLGFLGGAVAAGPSAAKAAIDTTLADAGYVGQGLSAAACNTPAPYEGMSKLGRKLVQWVRSEGVPEWKKRHIERNADHWRASGIDPDLACLKSVSPGYKAREQRRRNIERETERCLAMLDVEIQQRDFHETIKQKFGVMVGWYS